MREALSSNMDALVAVGLIVGTLLGATLLSVFFAVQIGAPGCRYCARLHTATTYVPQLLCKPERNNIVSMCKFVPGNVFQHDISQRDFLVKANLASGTGQESRAAVSSIHDALPSNWTAVGNRSAAMGPVAAAARAWLGDYEQPVLRVAEQAGPAVSTWLESRVESFAEANNLTEVHPASAEGTEGQPHKKHGYPT